MAKNKKWYSTLRATTVTELDGMQACIYHQTAVVKWDDKRVILDSGGFRPHNSRRDPGRTTKERMNQVSFEYKLGFDVWQVNYKWYVTLPTLKAFSCEEEEQLRLLAATDIGDGIVHPRPRQTVPFVDGMEFKR
jgi:hypothetical protein